MGRIAADATVFHAIADPTRRAILDLLREEMIGGTDEGRRTVLAMLDRLRTACGGITQSGFSQHLKVLLNAGLVSVTKRGRRRIYTLRPRPLEEIADWVAEYDAFWTARLDRLGEYLDTQHAHKRTRP
jgi:DNA-binding transcriptional ArsR family regulator